MLDFRSGWSRVWLTGAKKWCQVAYRHKPVIGREISGAMRVEIGSRDARKPLSMAVIQKLRFLSLSRDGISDQCGQ